MLERVINLVSCNVLKRIIAFALLFALFGCGYNTCIDADDYGYQTVKVPASYTTANIKTHANKEYVDWYDSKLVLNGDDLFVVVKNWNSKSYSNNSSEISAWCPWFGKGSAAFSASCLGFTQCIFQNMYSGSNPSRPGLACPNSGGTPARYSADFAVPTPGNCSPQYQPDAFAGYMGETCVDEDDEYESFNNIPCILTGGVGLYMLATHPNFTPNSGYVNNLLLSTPRAGGWHKVYHLGDWSLQGANPIYDYVLGGDFVQSGGIFISESEISTLLSSFSGVGPSAAGDRLFFKIMDTHYGDNSGQYIVAIKSGVNAINTYDPIPYFKQLVSTYLFGSDRTTGKEGALYHIVISFLKDSDYTKIVAIASAFFVLFSALGYLSGHLQMRQSELVIRTVKLIIVSQLCSTTYGWAFLYNYIFIYFINGLDEIINIINNSNLLSSNQTSWTFLTSDKIMLKIWAIIPSGGVDNFFLGLVFAIVYMICIGVCVWTLIRLAAVYIGAIVMMTGTMALAPIFLLFILFNMTKNLFETWLKFLIQYSLEAIIATMIISTMITLVIQQVYAVTGYQVCRFYLFGTAYDNAISLTSLSRSTSPYVWVPQYDSGESKVSMWAPIPHSQYSCSSYDSAGMCNGESTLTGRYCRAYECYEDRFPSFPMLDPNNSTDVTRLKQLRAGRFVLPSNIFAMILITMVLYALTRQASTIAQSLVSGVTDSAGQGGGYSGYGAASAGAIGDGIMDATSSLQDFALTATGLNKVTDHISHFSRNADSAAAGNSLVSFKDHKASLDSNNFARTFGQASFQVSTAVAKTGVKVGAAAAFYSVKTAGQIGWKATKLAGNLALTAAKMPLHAIGALGSTALCCASLGQWKFAKESAKNEWTSVMGGPLSMASSAVSGLRGVGSTISKGMSDFYNSDAVKEVKNSMPGQVLGSAADALGAERFNKWNDNLKCTMDNAAYKIQSGFDSMSKGNYLDGAQQVLVDGLAKGVVYNTAAHIGNAAKDFGCAFGTNTLALGAAAYHTVHDTFARQPGDPTFKDQCSNAFKGASQAVISTVLPFSGAAMSAFNTAGDAMQLKEMDAEKRRGNMYNAATFGLYSTVTGWNPNSISSHSSSMMTEHQKSMNKKRK